MLAFGSIANLVLASPDAATAEKKNKAYGVAFLVWLLILDRRYPLGETGSGEHRRLSNADATQPAFLAHSGWEWAVYADLGATR